MGRRLNTRLAKNLTVWLTAVAVAVQSIGVAAGGFLCIGCPNTETGVSLASAPCNQIDACCTNESAPVIQDCADSCTDHQNHQDAQDCQCVDVAIPANTGTNSLPAVKIILPLVAFVDICVGPTLWGSGSDESPRFSWTVRGGPPIVRSLAPSSRRTVFQI